MKRIACLGDSLTAGMVYPNVPYPQRLETMLGRDDVVGNYGISGYTVSQISTRYSTYARNRGHTHAILEGGVNDLQAGTAAATIWTTWSALIDQVVADGLIIIVQTVAPWNNAYGNWTAARQTETDTLNASIRAKMTAVGGKVLDCATLLADGADPTKLLAAYDGGDHIHWTQAGHDLVAAAALALL